MMEKSLKVRYDERREEKIAEMLGMVSTILCERQKWECRPEAHL